LIESWLISEQGISVFSISSFKIWEREWSERSKHSFLDIVAAYLPFFSEVRRALKFPADKSHLCNPRCENCELDNEASPLNSGLSVTGNFADFDGEKIRRNFSVDIL
jgi:hypothetical protein